MYYFEYWLRYFNECDNVTEESSGVVYAENYCDAVDKISQYYGDDLIESLEVRSTEDDCVYECKVTKKITF